MNAARSAGETRHGAMHRRARVAGACLVLALAMAGRAGAQDLDTLCTPATAAVADSVAALFDRHPFVFLGSTHGDAKIHDFLLCLLSRPAFQDRATDVLVEFANAVHQDLLDRYLLLLEPVSEDSLRQAWFNTDYAQLWARLPQMPAFFRTVRAINEGLDPARRIRVIGGNEPVDWSRVRSADDLARYPFKTNFTAHVVLEHFVTKPDARLLVVFGGGHIHHNGGTLMSDIEAFVGRDSLCVVGSISDMNAGEREGVAAFGDPDQPFFLPAGSFPPATTLPDDLFYAKGGPLQDYIDALIYLGPEPDRDLSKGLELTEAERQVLDARAALLTTPRMLELRFQQRPSWFEMHPKDLPDRP